MTDKEIKKEIAQIIPKLANIEFTKDDEIEFLKNILVERDNQLQHKEQDLETICKAFDIEYIRDKETNQIIAKCNKLLAKEQECDRYKQALEKIEGITEKSYNAPCLDLDCDCSQCEDETTDNGDTCMQYGLTKILNIITEVKEEEE